MFGELQKLRETPVPASESARALYAGYRDWPIDQTHLAHAEKLMHARAFGLEGRNYYAHARNPPYWAPAPGAIDALLLRAGVGARLKLADARLRRVGLKLFLYDAWRPRAVQAYFHDEWMPAQVRLRRPDLDDARVTEEVERYWAAPSDSPARPAPHATGGAVDLAIGWEDGEALYMGSLFDDATELAHVDYFERESDAHSFSHAEARANRRLLYWLLLEAGFASHPNEWWHFSYGDQMWAARLGKPAALYGLAEPNADLLK